MDIVASARQVFDTAKSYGSGAALHELQSRTLNRVVGLSVLRGMTAVLADVDRRLLEAPGFEVRFATRDELVRAAADAEVADAMDVGFVDEALARGDDCFGIFDGGTLASFGWYSRQPTRVASDLVLHFDPDWVYMYKGYTRKAYRGRRLHGIGMSLALQAYTARGARGLISYVKSTNFQSLRSTERMGYRIFGDLYVWRAGGRVRTWASPGCRRYGFRLAAGGNGRR